MREGKSRMPCPAANTAHCMHDSIELLSEALIDQHRDLALEVLGASSKLGLTLGWHYVLDLIWLLRELDVPAGATVLDAGAGWGLAQFLLADRGLRVISVDMSARQPRAEFEHLYNFECIGDGAAIRHRYLERARPGLKASLDLALATPLGELPGKILRRLGLSRATRAPKRPPRADKPTITLYHAALESLGELADQSVDAVVSVSALEHNAPADIAPIMSELERVARRGAPLLLTLSASRQQGEFHAASHSYLQNAAGFMDTYGLVEPRSNFDRFDEIAAAMKAPRYLERWLSHTYDDGVNNGMPGRVWAPAYLPVALRKTRR